MAVGAGGGGGGGWLFATGALLFGHPESTMAVRIATNVVASRNRIPAGTGSLTDSVDLIWATADGLVVYFMFGIWQSSLAFTYPFSRQALPSS